MDRRSVLRAGALAVLGMAARGAWAFSLPADPVFGRTLEDLQGQPVPLSRYLGRPVLMNFWASWCGPCVREMPMLEALHHREPQLVVLGLAIDTQANVRRFLQKVQVSYPLLLGGSDGIALMRDLGNKGGGLPFSVFFDRQGHLTAVTLGELKEDVLTAQLQKIL